MRHRGAASRYVLALVAGALALAGAGQAAPKSAKTSDLVWTHPDLARFPIRSIAMLPVATYDNSLEAEKAVAQTLGGALHGSGHRWLSGETVREMVRGDAAGEALLKRAREGVLKDGRVDSLLAPQLCLRLRTDALLAVRVDQWEQRAMEWNEAGKPSTTVRVRAALVDSLGRLLWTASGSESAEGPYHDPGAATLGVTGGTLGRDPLTNQGGPPSYAEVLGRLFARWTPEFPVRVAPKAP